MLEELLEKINKLEKNMELLLELHLQQASSLTTYNEVAKFLGKTRKTVYNYVKDGKLQEDIHYFIDDNGKTVFIPKAIIEFKSNPVSKPNNNLSFKKEEIQKESKKIVHPAVSSILKDIA
jgi:predicted P-loop ATPase/GTPase